jgi:hypothetical protein
MSQQNIIYTVVLPGACMTIQLPIWIDVSVNIDWGDGSDLQHHYSDFPMYTYTNDGTYTISVSGTFGGINTDNTPDPAFR